MSNQHIPEQHARRGRSRSARPSLPILPPFPDNGAEKRKDAPKNTKIRWEVAAAEELEEEDSRNDEVSPRMHDNVTSFRSENSSREQPKSRMIASSLGGDNQPPDNDTIPFDEQRFSDRKRPVRCGAVTSSNADSSARDQYQLSRLQARINQRKARHLGFGEDTKFDPKRLRAARIQVVRCLYKNNNQEDANENEGLVAADSEVSSVRDVTTLSSYRGKCFDKMMYLLHDVAPLEEEAAPISVKDEGGTIMSSNAGEEASVAELKLIKKTVKSKEHVKDDDELDIDIGDQSVAFPGVIDQPDTDTIGSKLSDVTSPTIHDGFELDEVPHYPLFSAERNNTISSAVPNSQREYLPSLAEVNENSEDSRASGNKESKSIDNFDMEEASRILGSISPPIQKTVEVDEAKKVEGSLNDEDEDMMKEDRDNMIEEITSLLHEREAEIKAKAKESKAKEEQRRTVDKSREDDIDKKPLPRVKKVTFFEPPSQKEVPIPHSYCCIIM